MNPLDLTQIWGLRLGFGLAIGAVVGSFAATVALRSEQGRGVLLGRSSCDHCARTLTFGETLPFLGYAVSRGQCQTCARPIDRFHLTGEALGAAVLSACWLLQPNPMGFLNGLLCLFLLVSALIDTKTLRLPDGLTLGIAGIALTLAVLEHRWVEGLLAAFVTVLSLYGLKRFLERRHGKPMFGLGDVKLAGALSLWLGLGTPDMLVLAALLGLAYILITRRKDVVPFGPMLAAASFVIGVCIPEGWLS